jgi:hypothetical protein
MDDAVGSVRRQPLAEIWRAAPQFAALRAPVLEGRCGACEYRRICGGCRARPLARSGELMGEDFLCAYEPQGGAVIEPMAPAAATLTWSDDAEARLARVPPFVRRMVRRRIEDHVRDQGGDVVTGDDLEALAKRRFGKAGPPGVTDVRGDRP